MQAQLTPGHDRVQRTALLGLRFCDAVDGRVVDEGLQVQLQDLWRPRRVQALVHNRSGVFMLHAWPGMPGFGQEPLASPTDPARFRLTLTDDRNRYLPVTLSPEVPFDGLWSPAGAWVSPPDRAPHVPLYSATTRPLPPAMASLRVELRRASQPDAPAAWARVEIWLGATRIGEGQADDQGRVLMVFPLPRLREATLGVSPAGRPAAFEWPVTLRAAWQPWPAGAVPPDFTALQLQPEVALLQSLAPDVPLPALDLRAGETLMAARPPASFVYVAD